jgi:CTP:molybdopterin cytidylyltransferase MocA
MDMRMASLKAVIPVAGLGMHMLPATKAIPKEMLPIVDKPMVQYIVDEIVPPASRKLCWLPIHPRMQLKTILIPPTNWKRCLNSA